MPFAPSCIYEKADELFHLHSDYLKFPAEFMTITFRMKEKWVKKAPAVAHIDKTARPQLVRKDVNPKYYNLLNEYYNLTGLPLLINTSFNIHEIIRVAIKNINNLIINEIDLIENFDPSLPNVSSDKNQLIILFENLIRNALESISIEGGYIKISTFFYFGEVKNIPNTKKNKSSNFILIEIEDNGEEIKEEFKDQIFLPFFSTKNKKGLGLYQAKKIALDNNCEIQFYSKKNVTTFKIWIPL